MVSKRYPRFQTNRCSTGSDFIRKGNLTLKHLCQEENVLSRHPQGESAHHLWPFFPPVSDYRRLLGSVSVMSPGRCQLCLLALLLCTAALASPQRSVPRWTVRTSSAGTPGYYRGGAGTQLGVRSGFNRAGGSPGVTSFNSSCVPAIQWSTKTGVRVVAVDH